MQSKSEQNILRVMSVMDKVEEFMDRVDDLMDQIIYYAGTIFFGYGVLQTIPYITYITPSWMSWNVSLLLIIGATLIAHQLVLKRFLFFILKKIRY